MAVSFNETFECPPGFQEEEVDGQLCLENIGEDSELWLIRMPSDIELSTIDRKKLCFSDASNPTQFETETGRVLECYVDKCEMPNIRLVLPQKSDKKLRDVKKVFKGSILISEGLHHVEKAEVKSEIESDTVENIHETDESFNLSQRRERKKKKRSRDTGNEEQSSEANIVNELSNSYSKSRHCDTEIKNEPMSSDFDELPCYSQK